MKLDVGCGLAPQGDVNIDIYLEPVQRAKGEIDPRGVEKFILADANHLPFREVFDEVISDNVLEHLEDPIKAINEMVRVSRKIIVRVPNKWGCSSKRPYHLWSFTPEWWRRILPFSKIWLSTFYVRGRRFIRPLLEKNPINIEIRTHLPKIALKSIIFGYDQINIEWKK